MKGSIIFLDSGVGGLPYLSLAKPLLPDFCLHYLADDAGFPYGTKTPSQVEDILLDRVRRLRSRLVPDGLVIACNTASQIALPALRKAHPDLPIIGTVPAIKPASASTKTGRIGVMATERTIQDPYIDDLIARYAVDVEVVKMPAQDLVTFVERSYLSADETQRIKAVEPYVHALLDRGVDRIVLACTHFLHLEKEILLCAKNLGAKDLEIVDSRQGVVRRLAEVVETIHGKNEGTRGAEGGLFLLTSEAPFDPSYERWATQFNLSPPQSL